MAETNLPSFIQQMMKPDFYPHPVQEPIQLIQTHVSYVLLTGDYAYKLKKAVNFGFLNFSTLELRQHFCNEEFRMNKRGAPEIYLEVLPITQTADKFQLGGAGEPVEYTLKMRQFPQDSLLLKLFERGELTEEIMEDLGRVVADFHAKAPINDYIRSFGEVEQIRQAIDENYQQTEKYIGKAQTQEQFDETKQFTDTFFADRKELFDSRIKNNWIRECHGDLHLRNICLWNGKLMLFDCIEFNEPFRFVDVMFDIAYAVMELEGWQNPELSNAYLNTYVEQTGDWEGLQVLPLYLSRQSYVRAKVTSFLLDDPGIPAAEKEKALETATHYYKLAWQYTKPRQGKLIMMSGVSGSGKSTVAKKLAREIGAIHIRSDAARKHLAGIPLHEKGGQNLYSAEMTQKTYGRLLELGITLASAGYPVILDAKYDRVALRKEVINAAEKHHLPLEILYCTAPEEVLRDRLSSRTGDVSDATAELLSSQLASAEPFTEEEQPFVKTIGI
ncbi:MAG TPA: AAA family ATPase [Leptolyngbyaceae cyanobacterium]